MLDTLCIYNFKCFYQSEIILKNINLFCGTNSSGKSSAIQALLLLAHNATENVSAPLNSQWISLGSFNEIRNSIKNAKKFSVSAAIDKHIFEVVFLQSEDETIDVETIINEKSKELVDLLDYQNRHIFYLPATRIGPEDYYKKNFDKYNFFGNSGEFVIDFFAKHQNNPLMKELQKDLSGTTLYTQVNYWLNHIMSVNIKIEEMGITNTYSATYSYKNNKDVRPYHIGSGVSYILGVIISGLSARKNDIVIIENPEIHLHPKAQSDLAEFLCFIANSGIQIVIESHSDHIFNGIRKAIAIKTISKQHVSINFFELDENLLTKNTRIEISASGRVVKHVKGLFDQFDDDLDEILGLY
jgi:predicted ATPase